MTEFSYNGWPVVDQSAIVPMVVAGVEFPGGVLAGDVAIVLTAFAQWWHETIEPLKAGDCWGYEVRADTNDPNLISCHASGTAIDLNAPDHPNGGSQYAGLGLGQVNAINAKVAEIGCLYWGANFTGVHDPMHIEIQGSAGAVKDAAMRLSSSGNTEDDMPYSEQDIKRLVYGGIEWFFQDAAANLDLPVLRKYIQDEVAKALPVGIKADPGQFQAAKEIVHDGAAWALEDPNVDVSRFPGKAQ